MFEVENSLLHPSGVVTYALREDHAFNIEPTDITMRVTAARPVKDICMMGDEA